MPAIEQQRLGESRERLILHQRSEFRQAIELMAQQASRSIDILTYDLDKPVYDQAGFLEAVKQLALRTPGLSIRILLQQSEKVQKEGHRLIDLARRVTSRIEIRRPHADYIDHPENFIVVDRTGYVRRSQPDRYEGEANFCHPLESKLLSEFFTEVWDKSEVESTLRRLYL
ncbi:MAG: acyltransferase [Sedimenticola sp.]|nr:acyltransferase [Sedimenticola sp.]